MSRRTAAVCLAAMGAALFMVSAACRTSIAHVGDNGYSLVVAGTAGPQDWIAPSGWGFVVIGAILLWKEEIGFSWLASREFWGWVGTLVLVAAVIGGIVAAFQWQPQTAQSSSEPIFDPSKPYIAVPIATSPAPQHRPQQFLDDPVTVANPANH